MDNLKRNSIKQEKRDNELWLACIIEFQLSIRPVWRLTSHKYASACVCILLGIVRIQYGFKRYGRGRLQLLLHILQTEHGRPIPLDPINFQGSSKRTASQGVEILPKLILSPLKKNFMYESEYWRRQRTAGLSQLSRYGTPGNPISPVLLTTSETGRLMMPCTELACRTTASAPPAQQSRDTVVKRSKKTRMRMKRTRC